MKPLPATAKIVEDKKALQKRNFRLFKRRHEIQKMAHFLTRDIISESCGRWDKFHKVIVLLQVLLIVVEV